MAFKHIFKAVIALISIQQLAAQEIKNDSTKTVQQQLQEVVITASREQQQRNEVAAAITSISAKDIENTKPIGLEQIVNDAPGVFMATSKAGSNEQHFMAARSPISTKSLFLYIEDGLPIRPTAVFNHNALLEINQIALQKIEIVRGPASSIYGSEAIGGSFNFITKDPTKDLTGSLIVEGNDLGLFGIGLELSKQESKKFGFYSGTSYRHRNNGPIGHSDYHKFATTFKTVTNFSSRAKWINVIDIVDYKSDMAGSLNERNYQEGNYESNQTFTSRIAKAFRFRSTLDKKWSNTNKTSFNFIFRDNTMDQNPSYRIRQFRQGGQLTGLGKGEVNSNKFKSFVGLVQHKIDFDFLDAKLIIGASADYSPQEYHANPTSVIVNVQTGTNENFTVNENEFILNYKADIFNTAGYAQFELKPMDRLHLTAGIRYDNFSYDYDNLIEGIAGVRDNTSSYNNIAPKIGANYNFSHTAGIYANIANGFSPPQVSSLYRNRHTNTNGDIFDLKPSSFYNYEIGGYFNLAKKVTLDAAIYLLEGKDRLVTTRNTDGDFVSTNAGKTRSYGIEYGILYTPFNQLTLSHNGSFSQHRYVTFFDGGTDYSDTDMNVAPNLVGTTRLTYRPDFLKNFSITAEYELMGKYKTSFKNQVGVVDQNGDSVLDNNGDQLQTTSTYDGHHVFNLRAAYRCGKFEFWGQLLNVFDELYSIRASYNQYSRQNSYSIGNPRAIHAGIKISL